MLTLEGGRDFGQGKIQIGGGGNDRSRRRAVRAGPYREHYCQDESIAHLLSLSSKPLLVYTSI
jgi:hypothetical protein